MTDKVDYELIIAKITQRGNDVEIRKSKDGIKVFEVSKKLIAEIPKERKAQALT